jgi:carboxyl-terminal processing protease
LAIGADDLALLALERAEFEAVFGRPVVFGSATQDRADRDVWDVVVDPASDVPTLTSDLERGRLTMTIPTPERFMDGVNLLHSLAFSPQSSVSDAEAESYEDAFDRICDEVAHVFPSMQLRQLDWDEITSTYAYVRELKGPEFWGHAARWVAELGDAHTSLIPDGRRYHPPYLATMTDRGARLLDVPVGTDAWDAGVRVGDLVKVESPQHWLRTAGATSQQQPMIAARRFLAMTAVSREFSAVIGGLERIVWTETERARPTLIANGNLITISTIGPDLPAQLLDALRNADAAQPLTLDLRGNTGGSLLAAAEARRLLIRNDDPFGTIAFTTGRGALAPPAPLASTPHHEAWRGDTNVLIDAMTYSAAEDLIHPLIGAPHVTIRGGPSGGGSGRAHTRLIKDGVRLATSTAITYTRDGRPIEYLGIQPGPRNPNQARSAKR